MKTFLAIILLTCSALSQDEAAIAKTKAACGPDKINFDVEINVAAHPTPGPEEGKAVVYVIGQGIGGDKSCAGCNMVARIGLDGVWAGAIRTTSYISFPVEPGEHHLCANWQSRLASRSKVLALSGFTAEAGKIYYFRMRVFEGDGFYMDLDLLNDDEGRYLIDSSPVSELQPRKHD